VRIDIALDVIAVTIIVLGMMFYFVVVLADAVAEIGKLARAKRAHLIYLRSPCSPPANLRSRPLALTRAGLLAAILNCWVRQLVCALQNGHGAEPTRVNGALDFVIRLDKPTAVESFEAVYDCVDSDCVYFGELHKHVFSLVFCLCVVTAATVFAGELLDLEVNVWYTLLYVIGGGTT